ncbi:hypothetical protein GX408_18700 [bacterium]|nr:hypothetical protein [bacterium]
MGKGVVLRGLIVHSCTYGIWISESDVTISDCYIGTDASGTAARPNGIDGVLFIHGAKNGVVERSLLSGNGANGSRISGRTTSFNTVVNNRIGTNADGSEAIPNAFHGVFIHSNAKANFIEGNLISGNKFNGISVSGDSTSSNNIRKNKIGTNRDGEAALGNGDNGIAIDGGSDSNLVEENLVSGNGNIGIHLINVGTNFNLIRSNRIGTDFSGHFTFVLTAPPVLPQITATAADYMGSTSVFSAPLTTEINVGESRSDVPRHYHLGQNYPNPFNPVTTLQYELPRAGDVCLVIYDRGGRRVRNLLNGRRQPGVHCITWDGTDDNGMQVTAGLYLCRMHAATFEQWIGKFRGMN